MSKNPSSGSLRTVFCPSIGAAISQCKCQYVNKQTEINSNKSICVCLSIHYSIHGEYCCIVQCTTVHVHCSKSKIWIHLGKSLIHKMTFFFCQMALFGSQGADAKSIFLFPVFSLKVAGECQKPAYNFFPLLLKINIFCNTNN